MNKKVIYIKSGLIASLLYFLSIQTALAAPLSLTQVDTGDLNVGIQHNSVSDMGNKTVLANGDAIFSMSYENSSSQVYYHTQSSDTTTLLSVATDGTKGDGYSYLPSVSLDGRYISFTSTSTNLVTGDTNNTQDIFLRDTQTNTTTRISVATDGTEGNDSSYDSSISSDGRYIAFRSNASNLVAGDTNGAMDIFLRDTQTNTTTRISIASDGTEGNNHSYNPSISSNGRYIVFTSSASNLIVGDTNGMPDIFLRDTQTNTTTRISVATDGSDANHESEKPSISSDGRYITFQSYASNLVVGDTNGTWDVFMKDMLTNSTTRISIATDGSEGNNTSYSTPFISSDGRYITFQSSASNLVTGDTNNTNDIFLRDTQTNTTTRISVATDGTEGNGSSDNSNISSDGRYITFESNASNLVMGDTNNISDIFLRDTQTNTTTLISHALFYSMQSLNSNESERYITNISTNNRYIAFESNASNLVAGDTNNASDIFLRDTQTNTTTRISVATDGTEGNSSSYYPSISSDGRYVTFYSTASNLVSGDTNKAGDIFLRDTQTNTTTRISVATDGTQGNYFSYYPSISSDGRYITFYSYASNLVSSDTNSVADIFLRDTQTNTTTRISVATDGTEGNANSNFPSISSDGRYITFYSYASNLVVGDTNNASDIFLRDTQTNTTTRISVATNGTEGNSDSYYPSISSDGRYVTFYSNASNLVSGDTNNLLDVFLRDTQTNTTTRISVATDGTEGNNSSYYPSISSDGRYVTFYSTASNLVLDDTNNASDIFVKDTQANTTTRISTTANGIEGNYNSINPSISPDGTFIAFISYATNLLPHTSNGNYFLARVLPETVIDTTPPTVPTPPIVSNLTDGTVYINTVTPTFTKGNATLDGNPYTSGTPITSVGSHILIVTDVTGVITIHFTVTTDTVNALDVTPAPSKNLSKAKIDSWSAYRYDKPGLSCTQRMRLDIDGRHFAKGVTVTLGGKEAISVDRKSKNEISAVFCMTKLLDNQAIMDRHIEVTNPDTSSVKAKRRIHLLDVVKRLLR